MNIYDIAREAGVSISTVSRVMNGKTNVLPETRKRVQAVLDKHRYTPSAIARGLVSRSMQTVAIVVAGLIRPPATRMVDILARGLADNGYQVLLHAAGEREEAAGLLRRAAERKVDGVALIGPMLSGLDKAEMDGLSLGDMPAVCIGGAPGEGMTRAVLIDGADGIRQAAYHLAEKGHRQMVYVQDAQDESAFQMARAFSQALEDIMQAGPGPVIETAYGLSGGEAAAADILSRRKKPTAVVCASDWTAVGVMKGLSKAGIRIPQDMAVTGYGNTDCGMACTPEMTTVDDKCGMAARLGARLLESLMRGEDTYGSLCVRPELILRRSS